MDKTFLKKFDLTLALLSQPTIALENECPKCGSSYYFNPVTDENMARCRIDGGFELVLCPECPICCWIDVYKEFKEV